MTTKPFVQSSVGSLAVIIVLNMPTQHTDGFRFPLVATLPSPALHTEPIRCYPSTPSPDCSGSCLVSRWSLLDMRWLMLMGDGETTQQILDHTLKTIYSEQQSTKK
jgi:hypothetical protein